MKPQPAEQALRMGHGMEPDEEPGRVDVHGQPCILGYRRVVHPGEADVVRRIFEFYASGWSHQRIAHQLNAEASHHRAGTRGGRFRR